MAVLLSRRPSLVRATLALSLAHPTVGQSNLDGVKIENCEGQCGTFCETEPIGTSRYFLLSGFKEPAGKANVWGSGPEFFWNSYVDEAAYFAGLLGNNEEGYINVTCVEEPVLYVKRSANGVTTRHLTPGGTYKFPAIRATPGAFSLQQLTLPNPDIPSTPSSTSSKGPSVPPSPTSSTADGGPSVPIDGRATVAEEPTSTSDSWADYWQVWTPIWTIMACVIICLVVALVVLLTRREWSATERDSDAAFQIRQAFAFSSSDISAEEDDSVVFDLDSNTEEPSLIAHEVGDDVSAEACVVNRSFTRAEISPGSCMTNPLCSDLQPASSGLTPYSYIATPLTNPPSSAPIPREGEGEEVLRSAAAPAVGEAAAPAPCVWNQATRKEDARRNLL